MQAGQRHADITFSPQFVHSRIAVLQEALQLYRQRLEARRNAIEGTFGRRGGLQRPTVDLPELEAIATVLRDTLSNAVAQMREWGRGRGCV